ncbi:MAG: RIP metalloprotease RseP [Flavobacteriales bacterium]|jgi:regulator of sigma E protease|nr:RIP metalloprotease RseP [Flavobacteriales bacterium]MBT5090115.1 RIP metalloprotease RseP [Flavobacteriales bacterium]MBT5750011.1 RIP metalloprotease RseP [Flavobacteriales bacterium]
MDFLIKAVQLLMSLSILVVLHELGHFIPAKIFKTRVEKFYLFFDPWFSVVKKKIGDTEYGIGWLPLGGYVKISGMIDESMDKEQMDKPAESWEFRAKPAWQRLIIMLGGVTVNLFLGIFIYSMTLYIYGDKYLPIENIKDGIWCTDDLATEIGFKNKDKIISADGVLVGRYSEILEKVITSKVITVLREGEEVELRMPIDLIDKFLNNKTKLILYPRIPTIVSRIEKGSNAEIGGLQKKDIIKAVNGMSYSYFDEFKKALNTHVGDTIELMVDRGGEEVFLTVLVSDEGFLGFSPANLTITQLEKLKVYELASDKYGFFAAFPAGYNKAIKKLGSYISQFKMILSPSTGAYKGMGGFGAIGSMFPATWNWEVFWNLTAFLSLMLAFMNILPIPALDGGHVVFLLYEIVIGKPAPEKIMEYAQVVGMILLLSLLVFANGNDILKLF